MPDEKKSRTLISGSPEETIAIGRKIGGCLCGGEILALIGPLGSGKTHLIKGLAAGAGVPDTRQVVSPTFVIVNEYSGGSKGLEIYHIDAYRIESIEQFEMLGFDDMCYARSVVIIEWADRVKEALQNISTIRIQLEHLGPNQRKITVEDATGAIYSAIK